MSAEADVHTINHMLSLEEAMFFGAGMIPWVA
jgi:hypothetical protein